MLPVVRGDRETARQILLYSVVLVACSLVAWLLLGPLYTAAAALLGARVPVARRRCGGTRAGARGARVPLLARLPRAALRGGRARPGGALMLDPQLARKNMLLGWALFGIFLLLFAGTCVVALIYLQLD